MDNMLVVKNVINLMIDIIYRMKKLMWKDVPNPNNCSWAKGMDFRQV